MSGSQAVRLDAVRKSYGAMVALDDLSLSVAAGEFLTLLGPSGSGKTTCLRVIAGMIVPDRGRVFIADRNVSTVPMQRRNIGMVFQNYSLFPHMDVARNVAYPLLVRRTGPAEVRRRVDAALRLVRLDALGERRPDQLSGGQQQRVALARALVFDPDVLLLDEPLSALDRVLREEMQLELRRIHRETGKTMVCVTHDRSEALTMADRIVVMQAGRIVQSDAPRAIYERSGSRFVAEFLGEANVIPMMLTHGGGGCAMDAAGRVLPLGAQADGVPPGPVDCVIRVENVTLAPGGAAAPGWQGTIMEAVFLGDALRFVVRCEPHVIVARVPLAMTAGLSVGHPVTVGLSHPPPMVFPRAPA